MMRMGRCFVAVLLVMMVCIGDRHLLLLAVAADGMRFSSSRFPIHGVKKVISSLFLCALLLFIVPLLLLLVQPLLLLQMLLMLRYDGRNGPTTRNHGLRNS